MSEKVQNKNTAIEYASNAPRQEVVQRDSAIWKGLKNGANATSQGVSTVSGFLWNSTKAASDHTWNGLKYAGYYSWMGTKAASYYAWNGLSPIGGFLLRTNVDSLVQKELGKRFEIFNLLQIDGKTLQKRAMEQLYSIVTEKSSHCGREIGAQI